MGHTEIYWGIIVQTFRIPQEFRNIGTIGLKEEEGINKYINLAFSKMWKGKFLDSWDWKFGWAQLGNNFSSFPSSLHVMGVPNCANLLPFIYLHGLAKSLKMSNMIVTSHLTVFCMFYISCLSYQGRKRMNISYVQN